MQRTTRPLLPAFVAVGLLLIVADSGAQIATATLAGVVRDDTGGVLPGVTLTLGADFIDELGVGGKLLPQGHSPRSRIGLGIVRL
jgi:hypothetical protein